MTLRPPPDNSARARAIIPSSSSHLVLYSSSSRSASAIPASRTVRVFAIARANRSFTVPDPHRGCLPTVDLGTDNPEVTIGMSTDDKTDGHFTGLVRLRPQSGSVRSALRGARGWGGRPYVVAV